MYIRTSNKYECPLQVELTKVPRVPDSCLGYPNPILSLGI